MANQQVDDWLSRVNIPDVYPRRDDPFRPPAAIIPPGVPASSMVGIEQLVQANVWDGWLTTPSTRPIVYQRALNFNVTANVTPVPLTSGNFQCDTIVLDVDSGLATSAFYGFSGSLNTNTGIEIRPGLPQSISPDNNRELWELQRVLEAIAGMIGAERGYTPLGTYRAPRVVFDASDIFLVATAAVNVRVMLFLVPEYQ